MDIGYKSLQRRRRERGQAVVEFALTLVVLLLLIFAVVEGGRLLHGWLTLQNAAREGGRYAITGQYEESCLADVPACPDARVWSIEKRVIESSTGLAIDPRAGYNDPRYLRVEVSGVDKDNEWQTNFAGVAGKPVMVRAVYHMPLVTPVLRPIAESIRLTGQVVVNNENYAQVNQSRSEIEIGDLPAPPPPVLPVADLEVQNNVSPLVSLVDQPITYFLQVINHGPDEARGVEVINTLADEVTLLTVLPEGICTQTGQILKCNLPNLPRGVSYDIKLTVRAPSEPPPAPGTVVNRVTVSGSEADDDLTNNEDSASTVIVISEHVADLAIISIDDIPDPVVIDNEVTYRILVRNNGISDATGVQVRDDLPEGFTYLSGTTSSGNDCNNDGGFVVCELGDLPVDGTGWADVTARARSSPGSAVNGVSVWGDQVDPDERNNASQEVTTVSPVWSDLYISMVDSPDPVLAGGEITYSIIAGNNGPSDATELVVTDTLPDGVSFVSATTSQGNCSESDGIVACVLGALARRQEASIQIVVAVGQSGTVTNLAAISGKQTDPNPVNDTVTAVTTVSPSADLSLVMVADPPTPPGLRAGEKLTYRLTVSNDGPSPATAVELNDDLPLDASFLGVNTSSGTCSHLGQSIQCSLGNMAQGDSVDVEIEVIPEVEGVIVNTASVSGRQADSNPSNNRASDTTTVLAPDAAFITLNPICGDPGDAIEIRGFAWPSEGRKDVEIYWDAVNNSNLIGVIPDNGSSWTISLEVPASAVAGQYTVFADRQRLQAEATFAVPCPAPNLATTQPTILSELPVTAGEPVTFQVDVTNDGQLDAINQFFIGLYFDPPIDVGSNTSHIPQDYRVELVVLSWLASGDSRTVSITADRGFSQGGTHEVYVVVDSDPGPFGQIKELDEYDNVSQLLQVEVDDKPVVTPTPGPTPTATPPASEPGSLIGQAFLSPYGGQPLPQAGVEVSIYDINTGTLEAVGFTDSEGSYFLTDLYPSAKTVSACIIIDDIQYSYTATGIEVVAGQIAFKDLFLDEGLCQ